MSNTIPLSTTDPQDLTSSTLTPRQIAGAANGRLAAGAKSPEGLARSAANANKHSLTAKPGLKPAYKPPVILFNESPDAYEVLLQALISCLQPGDQHELILVHRMADSEWLRKRALHMESAAIDDAMRQQAHSFHANSGGTSLVPSEAEPLRAWLAFSKLSSSNPAFAALQRYAATHARTFARAERELRDYRIAKAESVHPAPEPLGPPPALQAKGPSQDHWQPLETIASIEDEASIKDEASVNVPDLDPSPEIDFDETKVTPPSPTPTTASPTHSLTEQPFTANLSS